MVMKKINTYIRVLAELNEQIDALSNKEIPAVVVYKTENGNCGYRNEVFGIEPKYIKSIATGEITLTPKGLDYYYTLGWISKDDRYSFIQINDYTIHSIVCGILYSE